MPWTKPGGLELNESDPISVLGTVGQSFATVFMDGSVRNIAASIDPAVFSLLLQHNDGKPVSLQ